MILLRENTQRIFRGHAASMMDVLMGIFEEKDIVDPDMLDAVFSMNVYEDNSMPMYVATNTSKINGTTVILYDGLLKKFAEKVGGDFYVLPSSLSII